MKKIIIFIVLVFIGLGAVAALPIVKSLKIRGNKKLKVSIIRKLCHLQMGNTLDSNLMEMDIRRLKRLPAVSHAYFQVDSLYNVTYTVEENFTIIPDINIYTTTGNVLAFRIGVDEYNFLGRNIKFGGFYQNDNFNSFGIGFKAPNLISEKLGFAIHAQSLTTLEPVFLDGTRQSNYMYANKSIELMGIYAMDYKNTVEIAYSQFMESYTYEKGATSSSISRDFSIRKALYKAIHKYNNLDYYYQYVSGFKSRLEVQYVTPLKKNYPDFAIARFDVFYFKRIKKKFNLANRLRLGVATNSDSPFAPFEIDNNTNIRGVGNTVGRGTAEIVLNSELRYTILDKKWFILQSNVFMDAGTWRNPAGNFSDFSKAKNTRLNTGLGLRFINKRIFNAVFRVDYGFGILKQNNANGLVIGIGQYF